MGAEAQGLAVRTPQNMIKAHVSGMPGSAKEYQYDKGNPQGPCYCRCYCPPIPCSPVTTKRPRTWCAPPPALPQHQQCIELSASGMRTGSCWLFQNLTSWPNIGEPHSCQWVLHPGTSPTGKHFHNPPPPPTRANPLHDPLMPMHPFCQCTSHANAPLIPMHPSCQGTLHHFLCTHSCQFVWISTPNSLRVPQPSPSAKNAAKPAAKPAAG